MTELLLMLTASPCYYFIEEEKNDGEKLYVSYFYIPPSRASDKYDKNESEKVLTTIEKHRHKQFLFFSYFLFCEKKGKQYHNNNKKAVTNEIKSVE